MCSPFHTWFLTKASMWGICRRAGSNPQRSHPAGCPDTWPEHIPFPNTEHLSLKLYCTHFLPSCSNFHCTFTHWGQMWLCFLNSPFWETVWLQKHSLMFISTCKIVSNDTEFRYFNNLFELIFSLVTCCWLCTLFVLIISVSYVSTYSTKARIIWYDSYLSVNKSKS